MLVILNKVKNLIESIGWKTEILRLTPQNDIATQSLSKGGARGDYSMVISSVPPVGHNSESCHCLHV